MYIFDQYSQFVMEISMAEEHILYGVKPLIPISTESVGIQFYNHLKTYSNDIAFSDPARNLVVTNRDVLKNSCALALKFKDLKLNRGDVVGLCVGNEPEFFYVLLASFYIGLTVTTINPKYKIGEMKNCVDISKPKIIFATELAANTINQIKSVKEIVVNLEGDLNNFEIFKRFTSCYGDSGEFQPEPVDVTENVALIVYSSGTTGLPKGVCLTHKNINCLIASSRDVRYKERYIGKAILAILPFFHTAGLLIPLLNLLHNKEVVLLKSFVPDEFLKTLQDKKVEVFEGVPTLVKFLANSPLVDKYSLSLKVVTNGSGLLIDQTVNKLINRLKLKTFWCGYGMTELSFRVTSPTVGNNKLGSCGQLFPYMVAKVVDVKTGKNLGPLKRGELCFKGPQIMKGYKNNELATSRTIDKYGWLHSGDLGYYDDDGHLFIIDRLKELIKYKEYQVSPAELEMILTSHPKILDAAVVGVPNEHVGELPTAFVVTNPKEILTETEVQEFVLDKVTSQKRLRGGVIFVSELPKSSLGKLLRQELKSLAKSKL